MIFVRTVLVALCMVLMVVGCTRPAAPAGQQPEPPVAESPGGSSAGSPGGGESAAPGGTSQQTATPPAVIESLLPVPAPLPDGLRRVELPAGHPVESVGLYFMDVATGNLDGWLPPVGEYNMPAISLWSSDDERWVLASDETTGYLIRRSDGAAFVYDREKLQITVGPGVILARPAQWSEGQQGQCALLDAEAKLLSTFAIDGRCTTQHQVLFSPDGKTLALMDVSGGLSMLLVTAATGEVKELGPFPELEGKLLTTHRMAVLRSTGDLVLELYVADAKDPAKSLGNLVRLYSWSGELRAERQIDGYGAVFSPDGKLISYAESMGRLGQAPVVEEWGAEQPRFRVAGGLGARWLADSSEVLVQTSQGYRLVSATGALTPAPPSPGSDSYQPFVWLFPSPDDANLFLTSATVIERNGQKRREATLAEGEHLRIEQVYWGPTSASYHFMVMPPLGKGWEPDIWYWLIPKVQRPPYPEQYPLQVEDPEGECLNLRAEASSASKIIRCLPTGTRLALGNGADSAVQWLSDWVWL